MNDPGHSNNRDFRLDLSEFRPDKKLERFLNEFAQELIRWNQRINLVSRQGTQQLLQDLFRQCVGGAEALWACLEDRAWVGSGEDKETIYFDLGSGGGIPGAIWNQIYATKTIKIHTCLVEPREKRAWFLERIASLADCSPFSVYNGQWESASGLVCPSLENAVCIISLKALHLTDPQVLEGLEGATPSLPQGMKVAIARYYPSSQILDGQLVQHLQLPAPDEERIIGSRTWLAGDPLVLPWAKPGPREACLVVSFYS